MRLFATGLSNGGRSSFLHDGAPREVFLHEGSGLSLTTLWAVDGLPQLPVRKDAQTLNGKAYFPAPQSSRFVLVTFPCAAHTESAIARGVDMDLAAKKFFEALPSLGHTMESENPGMHTSQTIDFGVVLSGEVDLELDDGQTRTLRTGDCWVQNGTRHAWRNHGSVDCRAAVVMIGAVPLES